MSNIVNFIQSTVFFGEILFCSGTSEVSKKIKQFTNSEYSHVGLLFSVEMCGKLEHLVIEAIQPVISIIPLEQYFSNYKQSGKPYPGKLFVGSLNANLSGEPDDPGELSSAQCRKIFDSAMKTIGVGYDTASIIKQAINKVFGLSFEDKDAHRLICSELVANAYKSAGIPFFCDKHGYYTPGSIALTGCLDIQPLTEYPD